MSAVRAMDPDMPDPAILEVAGRILREGGLVVIPTETVYGIAADAFNPRSVARLRVAKGRPETNPLPVMVSGIDEMETFAIRIPDMARRLARRFWPGPLTIVLYAGDRTSEGVHAGTAKVGLRAPDHPVAQAVLAAARRPLVLTSANLSGEEPARTAEEAVRALATRVDLVLDAGPCRIGLASTVLDVTTIPATIVREGAVPADELKDFTS